ncbi:serine/arginine-rich sc35-like splicing factor scl30a [Phtheirospermum japonicum]|uniref:Serine/arginine-rich sc35-like splicing factor scl30a n=1 Tax=Phtheirospermum japonicum TaxID=374723 RepID=A0A830B3G1_9LAMI|nr:serine/arginine-rich sc35-like splicing factor scl30a [Phtheirospermum japonicum]
MVEIWVEDIAEARLLGVTVGDTEARAQGVAVVAMGMTFQLAYWPEDLRGAFGEFGPLKDIYLPRDYYTGEPRGFGFVQYVDPDDAAEAKDQMDGQILLGRELTVVYAEKNRKKPSEMRAREQEGRPSVTRDHHHTMGVHILVHPLRMDIHIHIHILEAGGIESDRTQGLHMVQGSEAQVEAGAGAEAQKTTDGV